MASAFIQERLQQALEGWSYTPTVDAVLNAPKRGFNLALAPWIAQNPRFAPSRIWELLKLQTLHLSRRSFWGS